MKKTLFVLVAPFLFSFCFAQSNTTSIGFFYGPSIGYNAIHSGVSNDHGLLDISFETGESFGNSIVMLDDDDLTNNVELFNGSIFGVRANFPIIPGLSIQSELEIESISFNHILYQNSENAVFVMFDLWFSVISAHFLYPYISPLRLLHAMVWIC